MYKPELHAAVAARLPARDIKSKAALERTITAVFDVITEAAAQGESVHVSGFGVFRPVDREARTGRDPQTGKNIEIPAKRVLRFSASGTLKKRLN